MTERSDVTTPTAGTSIPPTLAAELLEQSLLVAPTLDLRDVGARLLAPLVNATHASRASLMIVNPETGRLRVVAGLGIRPEIIGRDAEWRPNSISEWVFRKRQGLVLNGTVKGEDLSGSSDEAIESALCVPLEFGAQILGVLNLARMSPAPVFADADLPVIRDMLPPVAAALERACRANLSLDLARQVRAASGLEHHAILRRGAHEARHYEFGYARVSSALEGGAVAERVPHANGGHSVLATDVSGRGADALLGAAWTLGLFTASASADRSAAGTAARMNAEMWQRSEGSITAPSWTAQLAPTGHVASCNAGYPAPLWVPSDDSPVVRLESGGPALGSQAQAPWNEEQVRLLPGDLVVAASPGVLSARNVTGQPFGHERLAECVCEMRRHPIEAIAKTVLDEVRAWSGREIPVDDVSVLVLRYRPGD